MTLFDPNDNIDMQKLEDAILVALSKLGLNLTSTKIYQEGDDDFLAYERGKYVDNPLYITLHPEESDQDMDLRKTADLVWEEVVIQLGSKRKPVVKVSKMGH